MVVRCRESEKRRAGAVHHAVHIRDLLIEESRKIAMRHDVDALPRLQVRWITMLTPCRSCSWCTCNCRRRRNCPCNPIAIRHTAKQAGKLHSSTRSRSSCVEGLDVIHQWGQFLELTHFFVFSSTLYPTTAFVISQTRLASTRDLPCKYKTITKKKNFEPISPSSQLI